MNNEKIKIFLVDDDKLYLKLLEVELLDQGDFDVATYSTGELCLKNIAHSPDVIVLDYYLDGIDKTAMNGIETLDKIKAVDPEIAVIMLSSQDSIDVAISCMHHKAFDYVVKSETAFLRLKKIIPAIFQYKKMEKQLKWYMERM
jgi:DNA-binding NtrC family response regulator